MKTKKKIIDWLKTNLHNEDEFEIKIRRKSFTKHYVIERIELTGSVQER